MFPPVTNLAAIGRRPENQICETDSVCPVFRLPVLPLLDLVQVYNSRYTGACTLPVADFFRDVGTPIETREILDYHGLTEKDLEQMIAASPKQDMKRFDPSPT